MEPNNGQPANAEPNSNGQPNNEGQPAGQADPAGGSVIVLEDGRQVTAEMYRQSQAEITRLQQERSNLKKMIGGDMEGGAAADPDEQSAQAKQVAEALAPFLMNMGFASAESIAELKQSQTTEKYFAENPVLNNNKEMIMDLAKANPSLSIPEIVAKYKIGGQNANQFSPSGEPMGVMPNFNAMNPANMDAVSGKIAAINSEEDLAKFRTEMGMSAPRSMDKMRGMSPSI